MDNQRNLVYCLIPLLALAVSAPMAVSGSETPSRSLEDDRQASGDLDRDGDADVIVARKQVWTNADSVPYKLMVNNDGVLVDRTDDLATDSGLRGTSGFAPPTDVGHITVADRDNDGWLDLVISVGAGEMPWIYINRCCSVGGCAATSCTTGRWLGLGLIADRDPDMMSVGIEK